MTGLIDWDAVGSSTGEGGGWVDLSDTEDRVDRHLDWEVVRMRIVRLCVRELEVLTERSQGCRRF